MLLRIGIIVIITILVVSFVTLISIKFRKSLEVYRLFNKNLILAQVSGLAVFILIHFAFTRYHYAARYLGSIPQLLLPNIYALIVGIALAVFLPWLVTFLYNRKRFDDYKNFKDWKIDFLQSSIGSLFLITFAGLGYQLFYFVSFGLIPGVQVPIIGYFYAYLMIGLLTSVVALVGLILTLILWMNYNKISKQQWLREQAGKIYTS